jgi:hypothetical protein
VDLYICVACYHEVGAVDEENMEVRFMLMSYPVSELWLLAILQCRLRFCVTVTEIKIVCVCVKIVGMCASH